MDQLTRHINHAKECNAPYSVTTRGIFTVMTLPINRKGFENKAAEAMYIDGQYITLDLIPCDTANFICDGC